MRDVVDRSALLLVRTASSGSAASSGATASAASAASLFNDRSRTASPYAEQKEVTLSDERPQFDRVVRAEYDIEQLE